MKKLIKTFLFTCLISILTCTSILMPVTSISAQTENEPPSIVVSGNNGQILSQTNADQPSDAGELTQIVTLYLIQKQMTAQNKSLDDNVPISDQAYRLSQDYDISNAPLRQDFEYTAADLLEAVWMKNAHGPCLALVEWVSDSEAEFIKLMNNQVEQWGFDQTQIHTATGLPTGYQLEDNKTAQSNILSAGMIATASYHVVNEFPDILNWTSQVESTLMSDSDDPYILENPNAMLDESVYNRSDIVGLKFDLANEDSYSLVTVSDRDQFRLISVVMEREAGGAVCETTGRLLDNTYASYTLEQIGKSGDPVKQIKRVSVVDGAEDQTTLAYADDFYAVLPIVDTAPNMIYQLEPDYEYFTLNNELIPPIEAGTHVGLLKVSIDTRGGDTLEDLGPLPGALGNQGALVTSEDIESAAWYQSLWRTVSHGFVRAWQGIRNFFVNAFN